MRVVFGFSSRKQLDEPFFLNCAIEKCEKYGRKCGIMESKGTELATVSWKVKFIAKRHVISWFYSDE